MEFTEILGTFGAPPLALMVAALLTERSRLLKLIEQREQEAKEAEKENQARLDQTANRLIELAERMSGWNKP